MNEITLVRSKGAPFSLKDAPSFIEAQFPVGRLSAESYKERKAGPGQTLTALGSYWKGRKPLILVRATVLGCLLPATDNPVADLRVFLLLMGMADESFISRLKSIKPSDIHVEYPLYLDMVEDQAAANERRRWRSDLDRPARDKMIADWLATLPYDKRLGFCFRPEEVGDAVISPTAWRTINAHLGTTAANVADLVEQLGKMRFGARPKVADTFAGGGSIPFEAARIGCDVYASDLNPIACMLTWGAFNIVGGDANSRAALKEGQKRVASVIESEIVRLGIEHDAFGNRAKAFLYCLETRCPKTGWLVPVAPSWVVSTTHKAIATLIPDQANRRYIIEVISGVSNEEMTAALKGTVREGRLVHPMNPDREGVAIAVIRGDHKGPDGESRNRLRRWDRQDFMPHADDIFQERLYAVQWISAASAGRGRQDTFFAGATADDLAREKQIEDLIALNLPSWQSDGLIPDMAIEPGVETTRLSRERGWTCWHHLFGPRDLWRLHLIRREMQSHPELALDLCSLLDFVSKLTQWIVRFKGVGGSEFTSHVFSNQALNPFFNWGMRAWPALDYSTVYKSVDLQGEARISTHSADEISVISDIYITDPPYADAVNYHEITNYFIAWLRKNPPAPFADWIWDTQRQKAVKGSDEKFRSDMVAAYRAMSLHMPENGIQVVMFTHQDPGVWADLASIMWAAGLRVTAAWNVVTEVEKPSGDGNYVQGTVSLVLRKRLEQRNGRRMNIEGEIEEEVRGQLARLHDLDEDWTSERLYTDGDLQLAAYAAALRVITSYETIDRRDVGADVFRKLAKGEKTIIRDLIDYAASVANNMLVPDDCAANLWRELDASSRFYIRMLDMEANGTTRFSDYQDFARTFSVDDYTDLMGSTQANKASLAGSNDLKGRMLGGKGFGSSPLRRVLFAVFKCIQKDDPKDGLAFLKTEFGPDYWTVRSKLVEFARYVALKTKTTRPTESKAADLLAQKLEVDRI